MDHVSGFMSRFRLHPRALYLYTDGPKQMCPPSSSYMNKAHQSMAQASPKHSILFFLNFKPPSSPIQSISGEKQSKSPSVLTVSSYWELPIPVTTEHLSA